MQTLRYRMDNIEGEFKALKSELKSENLVTAVTVLQLEHKALERNFHTFANDTIKPLTVAVAAIQAKQEQSSGLRGGLKVIIGVGVMAIFAGGSFFLALAQVIGGH